MHLEFLGLIVLGIVESGRSTLSDDSVYTSRGKTYRVYYLIVLVEFTLLSVFYYQAYSADITASPQTLDKYHKSGEDPNQRPNISFEDFLYQICVRGILYENTK